MQEFSETEQTEGLTIAIIKGLTCNGIMDWQKVTLKSGKEMMVRFSGSMVI
jgi:hypothetical protein